MPTIVAIAPDVDEAQHLRRVVGRLGRQLRVTAAGGLTASQLSCLGSVVRHGPLRVGDLATREGINPTSLSRILGRLEELGYVHRTPDPADRRSAVLEGTDAARRALASIEEERARVLLQRLGLLTRDQQAVIRQALPALDALIEVMAAPVVQR